MRILDSAAFLAALATPVAAQQTLLDKVVGKLLGHAPAIKAQSGAAVRGFAVAGVKLGMTPAQTRAALTAAGFTPQATDPEQDSWATQISDKVAQRRSITPVTTKVPMFTMASGTRGEHIEVWYAATPEGARATEIKYQIGTNQITSDAFWNAVTTKYGTTAESDARYRLYCSAGETSCQKGTNHDLPYLSADQDYALFTIEMMTGTKEGADRSARFDAEVERDAPKDAQASF